MNQPLALDRLNNEEEISIRDVIYFFSKTWKKLLLSGLVGALLGFLYWAIFTNYSAQLVMKNNLVFNVVTFKSTQKGLPLLASQIIDEKKVPLGSEEQFRKMEEPAFWLKNFVPNYGLTREEVQQFTSLTKELDEAATSILSFNLFASSPSKEQSLKNLKTYLDFIRTGGSYLELKNIFNFFEYEILTESINLDKDIAKNKVELSYLESRATNLESLLKKYPNFSSTNSQIVDLKDSGSKFLPLVTQIVAANSDINATKEALTRLEERQIRLKQFKSFYEKSKSIPEETFNGIVASKSILTILADQKKLISENDIKSQQELLELESKISSILNRYEKGIYLNSAPISLKKGRLNYSLIGFALAFLEVLIALIINKVVTNIKEN